MKFFRRRGRNDAEQISRPPASQAVPLYEAGRYAEAEADARAVARSRPRDDMYALMALGIAAVATNAQGRHADAVATYDEALPAFTRIFGADHWRTLQLRSNRAQALTGLGRHAECEAECVAVARAATRGSGPEMPVVAAAARNGLVFALNAQERHQEAEALAREALDNPLVQGQMSQALRLGLARSLNGQARHEEALAEAERAEELHLSLPEEHRRPGTGAVELAVATALLGLHRDTEARLQAAAAHDACLASFGPDHYRTVEARDLLDRIDGA
ncbi:tetratricopeptide repeat protein [Streptomyces sp. NBC_01340]|uniref:tetratricopeptide repeat protein n=1 Tax=unclassified Streptomyces TaxID=2593676 RepID=UPI002252405F|nr:MULTISPECIES: tetratricopeptide repeat protein [unclassified Streptomyces]MCX4454767.1 tetratricopeptide repeat protein [Streptomyces sp. NBC_01719]MCX4494127.1 tetratricopeptide repeat protein [Streptomyces sp. NBC_01728]WSI39190.1 tetratricopeptide repeat protein [Streptomyces sp. NBC_01340]